MISSLSGNPREIPERSKHMVLQLVEPSVLNLTLRTQRPTGRLSDCVLSIVLFSRKAFQYFPIFRGVTQCLNKGRLLEKEVNSQTITCYGSSLK